MKKAFYIAGFMLAFCLAGCGELSEGGNKSTGQVNEILVVTGSKVAWEGQIGDSIRVFFGSELPGMSQAEPRFDILNVPVAGFTDMFRKHHNVLIVEIGPAYTKASSETNKDVWAGPQRVITITAPDTLSFLNEFSLKKTAYLAYFEGNERERIGRQYARVKEPEAAAKVERKFGILLDIPGGFSLARESTDFIWLRHKMHMEKHDVEIGILIYAEDYEDTTVFDPRYIILKRDIITMENVPGPSENSFMKVAGEYIKPVSKRMADFPAGFAVETRGLWDVANDFMGGPFLSYTFVNERTNRVITLDGYVYNPNELKRDYLRQLETIFYSIRFIGTN